MKQVCVVKIFVVLCICLGLRVAYAEDLTKTFMISSPQYAEHLSYTRQELPFMMTAPKGWYMASRKPEATPGPEGVYFFKNDPEEKAKLGIMVTPYINVSFYWNEDIASAMDYGREVVAALKKQNMEILTDAEEITVDGETGVHFTTRGKMVKGEAVVDNYIFVNKQRVVMIGAIGTSAEFEAAKWEIREAIDSIKFKKVL